MPFPNMGNNPLFPKAGNRIDRYPPGPPSGARQGTAKPLGGPTCPQPLPLRLRVGNRLLHPLIANWDLVALRNVEGVRIPIRHFKVCRD